jgi:hypothetical protein
MDMDTIATQLDVDTIATQLDVHEPAEAIVTPVIEDKILVGVLVSLNPKYKDIPGTSPLEIVRDPIHWIQ